MHIKEKQSIWFSDLTHTAQGISANTFPLGIGCVYAYAKQTLGKKYDFKLFKFPNDLSKALQKEFPTVLCFSSYSWNFELAYKYALLVKQHNQNVITVFGGPNFPTVAEEKLEFFKKKPFIDFFVELEGELGFVDLIQKLTISGFSSAKLKENCVKILNTSYMHENYLVSGSVERIQDVNIIPSPYLTGAFDYFFDFPLIPMIETTRGCPFTCTFCSDGLAAKNKIYRYSPQRVEEELHYIAKRTKNVAELMISDLNFGMYKQDVETAKMIRNVQEKYNYPTLLDAIAGKNMPKRTIEVAKIIKNGWITGASIQSTDPEVLKQIKRSNISSDAYKELIDYSNTLETTQTASEIILALPGDTKEKHFESLRFGIDNNTNHIRMFQAMMLIGTEMASKASRKKYNFKTKFRTIPGCIGIYEILGKKHSIAEIEEIIIGHNTLNTDDYLECRIMNLVVETFYNDNTFEEVFAMLRAINVSVMDCLIYIKDHQEFYSNKVKEILKSYIFATTKDLYNTFREANDYILTPEIIDSYIGGDMGTNELLVHRALLLNEFDDVCDIMFKSVTGTLKEKGLLTNAIKEYLHDLKQFTSMRKKDPFKKTEMVISAKFKHDFEKIKQSKYYVDPNSLSISKNSMRFDFFHDQKQQEFISKQVKLYSSHAVGIAKMLQRTNLKLTFRNFAKSY